MSSRSFIAFDRGQILLASAVLIIGAIIGWVVPKALDDPENLQLWVAGAMGILVFVAAFVGMGISRIQKGDAADVLEIIRNQVKEMIEVNAEIQELIEDSIGRQAELIPRDRVYRDMAGCIRHAQREVAVITYLMADWESGKRTFLPTQVDTPFRGEFYDAVYEAIKNPKIEYIRVWQVPHDRQAEAAQIIKSDEHNAKEWDLIKGIESDHPDLARLIITRQLTTASFILVDRRHLFFNIDFFDAQEKKWHSPYMLFIKDATGDAFRPLQSVIVRLTNLPGRDQSLRGSEEGAAE